MGFHGFAGMCGGVHGSYGSAEVCGCVQGCAGVCIGASSARRGQGASSEQVVVGSSVVADEAGV